MSPKCRGEPRSIGSKRTAMNKKKIDEARRCANAVREIAKGLYDDAEKKMVEQMADEFESLSVEKWAQGIAEPIARDELHLKS
jgi:ribosomal protein S7